jgi:hypothetical protein
MGSSKQYKLMLRISKVSYTCIGISPAAVMPQSVRCPLFSQRSFMNIAANGGSVLIIPIDGQIALGHFVRPAVIGALCSEGLH